MNVFTAADLLLPKEENLSRWAVVACDQYTSQPEYWDRVYTYVGDAPSTANMILPEARLGASTDTAIADIHKAMDACRNGDVLRAFPHSFVYLERTLANGVIRRGVVGRIDLEKYEYTDKTDAPVRATEKTVVERIPPRRAVRQDSALDMSHVILFANDAKDLILGSLEGKKEQLPTVYNFDLMENGGHIHGYLVSGEDAQALENQLTAYEASAGAMAYAIGDGNHSLAAAKSCYQKLRQTQSAEELADNPLRYALVELENIHDEAQEFEPIHRLVSTAKPELLLEALRRECCAEKGYPVQWYLETGSGCVFLDPAKGKSAIVILQNFLDRHLTDVAKELDYIHGDDVVQSLSKAPGKLGLVLPNIPKDDFFASILADGVLPRKTFSVGHAQEKRFYLETRRLNG